jgi:hypothetical protein
MPHQVLAVLIHVIDGTYELFRHYYALPSARDADGREVAAVRGVLASIRGMLRDGATHIGVATDHVIESFRNGLWPGYKTGEGIDPSSSRSFRCSKRRSSPRESSSGRWSNSKPMMPLPQPRRLLPPIRASSA